MGRAGARSRIRDPWLTYSRRRRGPGSEPIEFTAEDRAQLDRIHRISIRADRDPAVLPDGDWLWVIPAGLNPYTDVQIYRKSGTWQRWHGDSALVEFGDHRYIIVGLIEDQRGGEWLSRMIKPIHELMASTK